MIKDIKENLENVFSHFNLSLQDFDEDLEMFNLSVNEYNINGIDGEKVFNYCEFFGSSFEINMRAFDYIKLSGNATLDEKVEFIEWIKKNSKESITLTIKFNKKVFLSVFFEQGDNIVLYLKPNAFKETISYNNIRTQLIINRNYTIALLPFVEFKSVENDFLKLVGSQFNENLLADIEKNFDTYEKEKYLNERIQKQKLYCNMGNLFEGILPDHLFFKERPNKDPHNIFSSFDYLTTMLCLHFLANISKKADFVFHGYKNIRLNNIDQHIRVTHNQVNQTFQLYDTIYEVQTQDKLLIARNVISIHLPSESRVIDFVSLLQELLSSLNANFDSYVQEKIKYFFDKKKDLENYIRDTCETISQQIAVASSNLNKSWLTLAGALIAGFITYSVRGDITILVLFFFIFGLLSILTLKHSIWIAKEEKKAIENAYHHFIGIVDGINKEEIDKVTGDLVEKRFKLLDDTIDKMKRFNIILPAILLGVLIGIMVYESKFSIQEVLKIVLLIVKL